MDTEIIKQAVATYSSDDIQIDDSPRISHGEDGAWVQAWVWVPTTDSKLKTADLTGDDLDRVVMKCMAIDGFVDEGEEPHFYSSDWSEAGPIIEREGIELVPIDGSTWEACIMGVWKEQGPRPLVAAMRCYVGSKLGNNVPNIGSQG